MMRLYIMIVNRKDQYGVEVNRLQTEIATMRYQLANIKVEAKVTRLVDLFAKRYDSGYEVRVS